MRAEPGVHLRGLFFFFRRLLLFCFPFNIEMQYFYFLICWLRRVFVAEWAFSACGLWGLLLITVCSLQFNCSVQF